MRSLVSAGLVPALTAVAVLTAGVLVFLVAGGIDLRGAAAVVAAVWLVAHQVPLTITGTTLGVLPLLPTAVLVWVTARSVAATGARGRRCTWVAGAAVLGPVLVTAVAVGVLTVTPGGLPLAVPQGLGALLRVAVVHALGAGLGLARPSGRLTRLRRAVPGWAWSGLVRVPELLGVLVAAGMVLTTLALVRGFAAAATFIGAGGGAGGAIGLVLLSTAYLPNVAIGALSVAVGPGAVVGTSTVTVFGAVHGPVLPLPVLAVLPTGGGSWWWPVSLLVPAAVGGLLGLRVLRAGAARRDALRSVLLAALVTGVVVGVLGEVAGGGLGRFSPIGVPALALAVAIVAWLGIFGGAIVLVLERATDTRGTAEAGAGDDAGGGAGTADAATEAKAEAGGGAGAGTPATGTGHESVAERTVEHAADDAPQRKGGGTPDDRPEPRV